MKPGKSAHSLYSPQGLAWLSAYNKGAMHVCRVQLNITLLSMHNASKCQFYFRSIATKHLTFKVQITFSENLGGRELKLTPKSGLENPFNSPHLVSTLLSLLNLNSNLGDALQLQPRNYLDYRSLFPIFFFRFYVFIFREGKRGRKRRRETSMCGCLSHTPYWGPGPQPRHVP